jgi:hypothetical protein
MNRAGGVKLACSGAALALLLGGGLDAQTAELVQLLPADGASLDKLGRSVSLDGDRALVGAHTHMHQGTRGGAAYVFERVASGEWVEVAELRANDAASTDFFGYGVSLAGDRALVGAPFDDDQGLDSGSAYVFERQPTGAWVQVAKLLPSASAPQRFGEHVSISGDRALVSSVFDDERAANAGAAYVFERQASGAWSESAKLLASDGQSGDFFGTSLALLDGRALVGAPSDDDLGTTSGSAYVFDVGPAGTWLETQKLLADGGEAGDAFGQAVALAGDRALVGAPSDDEGNPDVGSARLFQRPPGGGTWVEVAKLVSSDGEIGAAFGVTVSIAGDQALAGLPSAGFTLDIGSARVFEPEPDGTWPEWAELLASDRGTGDAFGTSVALSRGRALIGAPDADPNGADSGAAYVFDLLPLESAVTQVSLSAGESQPLELDAGHLHAGETYLLLGSFSGTTPGVPLASGLVLPLNPDRYFLRTLELPNRPPLAGSKGALNAAGHASANFSALPLDVSLAGTTLHHAFVTFGSVQALSTGSTSGAPPGPALATFASNAFPVLLIP